MNPATAADHASIGNLVMADMGIIDINPANSILLDRVGREVLSFVGRT